MFRFLMKNIVYLPRDRPASISCLARVHSREEGTELGVWTGAKAISESYLEASTRLLAVGLRVTPCVRDILFAFVFRLLFPDTRKRGRYNCTKYQDGPDYGHT